MKKNRLWIVCTITFLLMSQWCLSQEFSLEQLVAGVNQVRNIIESGEMRVIVTSYYTASKSPEEIQAWIEKRKEEILRGPADNRQELLKEVPFDAKWIFDEHEDIEELNVAFRILVRGSMYPESYQFKLTRLDRREMNLYSDKAKYLEGGYYRTITYDDQTEAYEELFPFSGVELYDSNIYEGWQDYELFGRSLNRVPSNAKLVGKEKVGNTDCYVLEFGELRRIIWIDPKTFCIRREERYDTNFKWEIAYEDFYKYGEIWFPRVSRWTVKVQGRVKSRRTAVVEEARFNLDFPPNFFKVTPEFYFNQDLEVLPGTETIIGLKRIKYQPNSDAPQIAPDLLKCGPNSLLHVCELLKVDTSFDELCKLSNYDHKVGATMLGLLQAARYKNLNPKGIKANIKALKLKKVPMPAIVYVKGHHFLVFEKIVSDGVLIFDPANKYEHYLSYKELSQIWNGEVLVFNYKPELAKSKSTPRVFVDSSVYDFGEATGGSKIKHTFKLKNIGNSTLRILKVRRTCKCTATVVSQDKIPPEEYGFIEAVLRVPSENREVEESVYVYTNSPTQNKIPLTFKGTAFMPITTFPNRVFFGKIAPKSTSKKTLTVHHSKGKNVQIDTVRVDSQYLAAKIVSGKEESITQVEVAMLDSMPIGPFYHKLFIDYFFERQKATHVVSIKGEVLGELAVSPRNIFFGLVDSKKAVSKTVTISHLKSQAFKIIEVQADSKYVTFKVTPLEGKTEYHIKTTITPGVPEGEFSDKIHIKTDSAIQPEINLPLYCIVSK